MRHQFIWDEEPLHPPTTVAHQRMRTSRSRTVSNVEGTKSEEALRERRRSLSGYNAAAALTTDAKECPTPGTISRTDSKKNIATVAAGGGGSSVRSGELAPLRLSENGAEGEAEEELNKYPLTREEKTENINEFFEELFNSIDYSLLLIFLGTHKTTHSHTHAHARRTQIMPVLIWQLCTSFIEPSISPFRSSS
jgi:hypothetical protein